MAEERYWVEEKNTAAKRSRLAEAEAAEERRKGEAETAKRQSRAEARAAQREARRREQAVQKRESDRRLLPILGSTGRSRLRGSRAAWPPPRT